MLFRHLLAPPDLGGLRRQQHHDEQRGGDDRYRYRNAVHSHLHSSTPPKAQIISHSIT